MSAYLTRTGRLPRTVFDLIAARQLGQVATTAIVTRTFSKGLDVKDQPFDPYSTTPTNVSTDNPRMRPRGGRKTKGGRSVHYAGGYRQYKRDTTGSDRVNLTLSGELQRAVAVLSATNTRIVIGVRGGAARHGAYLQIQGRGRPARVWMGISPNDRHVIRLALRAIVVASLRRQGVGVVG